MFINWRILSVHKEANCSWRCCRPKPYQDDITGWIRNQDGRRFEKLQLLFANTLLKHVEICASGQFYIKLFVPRVRIVETNGMNSSSMLKLFMLISPWHDIPEISTHCSTKNALLSEYLFKTSRISEKAL